MRLCEIDHIEDAVTDKDRALSREVAQFVRAD